MRTASTLFGADATYSIAYADFRPDAETTVRLYRFAERAPGGHRQI
jgi:hypothetical protein